MALENFAGPDYYTEFDPEKFIRDLKAQAEATKKEQGRDSAGDADTDGQSPADSSAVRGGSV